MSRSRSAARRSRRSTTRPPRRSTTRATATGRCCCVVETYRLHGHYVGDPQVYRPKGELEELRETQDPITKLRERLGVTDEEFEELDAEVREIVEESVEFAKNGTDPKPEDALKNVYA